MITNKENILSQTEVIKEISKIKIEETKKSKEEVINNITDIIKDKEIGKNYIIKGEDFTIIIKPTNSTNPENSTYIEFDQCEKILREKYNISNSSIITFFQMEIDNKDETVLYNQIKYFTYDDKKQELNLSLCNNIETKIHYSIKENSNLDLSTINQFKNIGVDILNIKDKFFSDICNSYSDSNNDMILKDRIKYLYQNYSLCEEDCKYNNIDINKMSITCDCKIQGNFRSITTPIILEQDEDVSFMDSNIAVIKCYNLVFSLNNKFSNIGFIIFSILIGIYLSFFIIFIIRGIKPISNFVFNEMEKYGYIKINRNKNDEDIKNNKRTKIKEQKANKKILSNPKKKIKIKIKKKIMIRKGEKNIKLNKLTNGEDTLSEKDNKESNLSNFNFEIVKNNKVKTNYDNESQKIDNFGIIKINLNEKIKDYYPEDSKQTLHNYTFEEAIQYDRRNIFRIFYIYLLYKQIIFHTFLLKSPLEIFSLRFTLFIFMLCCDLALNSLFYFNDNISKKYHYAKNLFLFAFSDNITIIIYSTLVSYVLITLLTKLSNSSNAIRKIFRKEEKNLRIKKNYKIDLKRKEKIFSEILNVFKNIKLNYFSFSLLK